MDIKELLNRIGYVNLQDCGQNYRTTPLYRSSGNNTSLSIKKSNGQWYDFGSREGGSLNKLVQLTLNLSSIKEANKFTGTFSPSVEFTNRHKYELSETKKFDKSLLLKLKKDHSYWEGRGISKRTMEHFQGGTTYNGRMSNRYVFPILDEKNELIGFSGRRLNDDFNCPKWKHLGTKTSWRYPLKWNYQYIIDSKTVVIVESIGDMLSLWDAGIKNCLVTFGIDISSKLIESLLRVDAQKILIAFNNDSDNEMVGNDAAIDCKKDLMKHFDSNQIIIAIPDEKDFGIMSLEQIHLWKNKFYQ